MEPSSQDSQDLRKQVFSLQNILAKTTENLATSESAPKELLMYVTRILKADAGFFFEYNVQEQAWEKGLNTFLTELDVEPGAIIDEAREHLAELAEVPKSGIFQVEAITGFYKLLMVPVMYKGQVERYFCILTQAFRTEDSIRMMLMAQMATGFFLYGALVKEDASQDWGFEQSAGLLEVLKKTCECEDYSHACHALANELQKYMECSLVTVAYASNDKATVEALSETANFDKRGNRVKTIQRALNEALSFRKVIEYPAPPQEFKESKPLHEHQDLHLLLQAKKIITLPLENSKKEYIGAISFIWTQQKEANKDAVNVITASKPYLESTFEAIKKARPSVISRGIEFFQKNLKPYERWLLIGGLTAAAFVMFVPFTYKISAPATLEPVLRRQIEAPFKSVLKQAFIEPGSIVRKGDLLAELEEKDLISQLAELNASREQALKQGAAALAEKDPAEARISQLEAEKLGAKIAILNQRKEKLLIKSPISGMVVQGELKRLEGSPLQVGETLLEIAPLDEMFIQVALPEQEFRHIEKGMPVELKLESFPGDSWESIIETIKPTATIREGDNVFILEAKLEKFEQELRPGMKGNAKIETLKHPLYWILLHKAWDFLRTYFFW